MNKILVYTVCNKNYFNIFNFFYSSLKKFNNQIDILVITDTSKIFEDFSDLKILKLDYIDWKYTARFEIFKFQELKNYETILFLDCDIICQKNLHNLFETIKNEKNKLSCVQSYPSLIRQNEWFLMNNYQAKKDSVAYNSGTFGFNINQIESIKNLYFYIENNKKNNICDQPIFNAFLDINNLGVNNLKKFVWLDMDIGRNELPINEYPLIHFVSNFGNSKNKFERIEKYYETQSL